MMRQILTGMIVIGLSLAGCATRPESIQATAVSPEQFRKLDCAQLNTRLSDTKAELVKLSHAQNEKADTHAMKVFLFGIPSSTFAGDHEPTIARLKGEVAAMEAVRAQQRCGAL